MRVVKQIQCGVERRLSFINPFFNALSFYSALFLLYYIRVVK